MKLGLKNPGPWSSLLYGYGFTSIPSSPDPFRARVVGLSIMRERELARVALRPGTALAHLDHSARSLGDVTTGWVAVLPLARHDHPTPVGFYGAPRLPVVGRGKRTLTEYKLISLRSKIVSVANMFYWEKSTWENLLATKTIGSCLVKNKRV